MARKYITYVVFPLFLFLIALGLRLYFFQGFVLGDDAEEFPLIKQVLLYGPDFQGHLQYRFSMWLFNLLTLKALGISEITFFLPTIFMSASFAVLAFLLTLSAGYKLWETFLASLIVATAPFEILLGTLRANDLILAWFLAIALLIFVLLRKRLIWQGIFLALTLWLAFYTKLWVIYVFPALGFYYLHRLQNHKEWLGFFFFTSTSFVLHAVAAFFWKLKIGVYFPFFYNYSASYPHKILSPTFIDLLEQYPRMIFKESEFHTALFGIISYLFLFFLLLKSFKYFYNKNSKHKIVKFLPGFDWLDAILVTVPMTFFLFLNFLPNSFKIDQYYSVPRIFRYLAPISFPIALFVAKTLLDFGKAWSTKIPYLAIILTVPLILLNFSQANQAVSPGKTYRKSLTAIVKDIRSECPPKVLIDSWPGFFLEQVFLQNSCVQGAVIYPAYGSDTDTGDALDYEQWLEKQEPNLPEGTFLVSGLASYVHYGCLRCGFLLNFFSKPLDSSWKLFKNYNTLNYLPQPEAVRLWRLQKTEKNLRPIAQ